MADPTPDRPWLFEAHRRLTSYPTTNRTQTMTNLISKAFEGHNIRIITNQQGEPW